MKHVAASSVAALVAVLLTAGGTARADDARADLPRAPSAPENCQRTLRDAGLKLTPWPLRPERLQADVMCEAPEGVSLRRGSTGLRFQPPARVNCAFALRVMRFEVIVQEEAKRILGSPVRAVVQLGTYNCRRMAAYPDLVSEHSFANAIDVAAFVLGDGHRVVVERDFVPAATPTTAPAALFLRRLARRLYDEQVFTVVLTPAYDKHHRNHFHLDGASYTVDGT